MPLLVQLHNKDPDFVLLLLLPLLEYSWHNIVWVLGLQYVDLINLHCYMIAILLYHTLFLLVGTIRTQSFSKFNVYSVVLFVIPVLCIRALGLIYLRPASEYPWTTSLPVPYSPACDNYHFTLCFYEFSFFFFNSTCKREYVVFVFFCQPVFWLLFYCLFIFLIVISWL